MAGIFKSQGVWSCGFDFLADGSIPAGGVFDIGSTGTSLPTVGAASARFTGKGVSVGASGGYFGRSLNTTLASGIHGFAFLTTALPSVGVQGICTIYDASASGVQATLGYNSTGQIGFYSTGSVTGSTISGLIGSLSAAGTIVPNGWNTIEILDTVSNSSGVLTLRINGSTTVTFSGDTQQTANAFYSRIYWGNGVSGVTTTGVHQFDDLYLLDLTAAAPLNTFLGPGRLQTDGPSGESLTPGLNAWTPTNPQGTDYANCANIPPNAAQYNSSGTLSQRMSLTFPALTSVQCLFLNTWMSLEQDSAGTRAVTPIYRSAGVDQSGDSISLSSGAYVYSNQASVTDPNTGLLWANENVSLAGQCEIGLEVTT